MKTLHFLALLLALSYVSLNLSSAVAAGPKTYQVTGPILELSDTTIVVQKGKDRWELARGAALNLGTDAKVGTKVTLEYTMTAVSAEIKADKKKK